MLSKRDILDELRRTAAENNGTPLGRSRFERETGIKPYDWMRYWVRFTDAQKEAGLTPNLLKIAHSENHLISNIVNLIRKLGRFPIYGELRIERTSNPDFPNPKAFFESKQQKQKLGKKIIQFCEGKQGYEDIAKFC